MFWDNFDLAYKDFCVINGYEYIRPADYFIRGKSENNDSEKTLNMYPIGFNSEIIDDKRENNLLVKVIVKKYINVLKTTP